MKQKPIAMRCCFLCLLLLVISDRGAAQQTVPLYPGYAPNSKKERMQEVRRADAVVDTVIVKVAQPDLTVYPASQATDKHIAVIICPGGGYGVLCIKWEGERIAKAFNKAGITAFVLKYRLPDTSRELKPSIAPLQDLQQAIKIVREQRATWHIDAGKIGIMGFSAGGHLAATAGTHFEEAFVPNPEKTSLRPDFMVLVYPVISFTDSIGHTGSRNNLLGKQPDQASIRFFS
ncbi:MAG: alpha/beta hydrolase, partial [Niabella sp.]|nr:alpha/beta hydrolase [Niabella sp.]